MHAKSLNNFKGLCILRLVWYLENLGTCFFLFWQLKVFVSLLSHVQKQPRLQDFLPKMKINVGLILNMDHETRKTRTRTWHVQNKNPIKFYWKNKQNKSMIRKGTQY
jgi:hypothetical protein